MIVERTPIPGVLVITPQVFGDERGYFMEAWNDLAYAELGIRSGFVQDNVSRSKAGVLRGFHAQFPRPQGKLVSVLEGEVYDVVVDIRDGSPTYGQWFGEILSGENGRQLWIPPGLLHGFLTLRPCIFTYKCTQNQHREGEFSVAWDDPDLRIIWPGEQPIVSPKDQLGMRLRDIPKDRLVKYV